MSGTTRRHTVILGLAAGAIGFAAPGFAQDAPIPARPFVEVPVVHPMPRTAKPMKIGVIGSGNIGGTLGELWAKAGHQVMFSDRDPALAKAQASRVPGTRAGSGEEAVAFADVILIAIPFGAWPAVAKQYGAALRGKIVIDPTNPNASRDGELAKTALTKPSTGEMVAEFLPGVKLVRAFNASNYANFAREANRPAPKMGIPVAASDSATLAIGVRLVNDIGFDAVPVGGGLNGSAKFELRGPTSGMHTAAELKTIMAK
jgi:8-hydroxy-5-deazaflavin:NADPH oxidoreductase